MYRNAAPILVFGRVDAREHQYLGALMTREVSYFSQPLPVRRLRRWGRVVQRA